VYGIPIDGGEQGTRSGGGGEYGSHDRGEEGGRCTSGVVTKGRHEH